MSKFSTIVAKYKHDPVNPMNWQTSEITLKQFVNNWLPNIDCEPIHQRVDVQNTGIETVLRKEPTKRQGIIGSIFKGIDISEVKINERTDREREKFSEKYESIDGGNRKRAIRDFINNKFPTNAFFTPDIGFKYFRELTDEQKERFFSFKIRFAIYEKLNAIQKSVIWEVSSNSTPVNHQEGLNGVGDVPIANCVRELARSDRKLRTTCHKLFETHIDSTGKIIGDYLSFEPTRLTYDRLVARILTIIHQGEKPCVCDDNTIENLYFDTSIDDAKRKEMEKKAVECLDFIYEIAQEKKYANRNGSKLTQNEYIILMRLYYSYKSRYKKFQIANYSDWFDAFNKSFKQFYKNNPAKYGQELVRVYDKNSQEKRERAYLFDENLRKGETKRWEDSVEWIEKNFLVPQDLIDQGILVVRDNKRCFTREDREAQLAKQNYKCYIDGLELNYKDAEAAHIKAYSDGGKTESTNMVMIRASHNRKMGSTDLEDYKKIWRSKNKLRVVA